MQWSVPGSQNWEARENVARLSATAGSTGFLWWLSNGVERKTGTAVRDCMHNSFLPRQKQISLSRRKALVSIDVPRIGAPCKLGPDAAQLRWR